MLRHVLSVIALAVMLGVLALALPGRAEAAEHDHHAAMAEHRRDGGVAAAPEESAPNHGDHDCHCVSAMCSSVLEPSFSGLSIVSHHALRHDRPAAADACPLASVDPPPRPPRA